MNGVLETGSTTAPEPPGGGEAPVQGELGLVLVRSVATIRFYHLPTGEIASFEHQPDGSLALGSNCLVSALVHEALGYLHPPSPWAVPQAAHLVPESMRGWLATAVSALRAGLRSFLAWHQEANGAWRLYGRQSGVEPDAVTTACAAACLLPDGPFTAAREQAVRGNVLAVGQFHDRRLDAAAKAHVLRFLALAGTRVDDLAAAVRSEIERGSIGPGTAEDSEPRARYWAVARTWAQCGLPARDRFAAVLIPSILERQGADGGFGDPLDTALAASALLDLGYDGPQLSAVEEILVTHIGQRIRKDCEPFPGSNLGSAALTAALIAAYLARCAASAPLSDR